MSEKDLHNLDPLQFAFRKNGSTEDIISLAFHSVLGHLNNVGILYIDCRSTLNTIILNKLIPKFLDHGFEVPICNWLVDSLIARPQLELSHNISSTLTLDTSSPQGCVCSVPCSTPCTAVIL